MFSTDIESALSSTFWGHRVFEGVDFYIEPDTELPEICPFRKPPRTLPCPHRGLSAETCRKYKQRAFFVGKPDKEKLFSKGLEVNDEMTFFHASYLNNRLFYRNLSCTNAIPLVIYGLTLSHNFQKAFEIARSSLIRPVYIYGSELIPVPADFRSENND